MKSSPYGYFDVLSRRADAIQSLLCVGLDPRVPSDGFGDVFATLVDTNKRVVDATIDYALAFKPNIAFYEMHGEPGMRALRATLEHIGEEVPVILDAKRGDIGSTAQAYAHAAFQEHGVSALTVSPYLGTDSLVPFLDYDNVVLFALCRTSNPSAHELQDISVGRAGEPLYLTVAETMTDVSPRVGLVVGATDGEALRAVRSRHPEVWILAPGVGAQGASAGDTVRNGADLSGGRIIPVAARAVAGADDPARAARGLRDEIERAREVVRARGALPPSRFTTVPEFDSDLDSSEPSTAALNERDDPDVDVSSMSDETLKRQFVLGLIRNGCFRTGEFTLKSGLPSPFYIDLRRVGSSPSLLRLAGEAYVRLSRAVVYDRIGAVPVAALPLGTAMALRANKPLLYPRIPMKAHGTGNRVEGAFEKGERVLLLDDLITTGKSKIEAIEVLRAEGLVVSDLVVLLERGTKGRDDMTRVNVRLHAFAGVEELVAHGVEAGLLTADDQSRVESFLSRYDT